MDVLIRDVAPDDAEGVTRVLNPISEARTFTMLDTPFSIKASSST